MFPGSTYVSDMELQGQLTYGEKQRRRHYPSSDSHTRWQVGYYQVYYILALRSMTRISPLTIVAPIVDSADIGNGLIVDTVGRSENVMLKPISLGVLDRQTEEDLLPS